MNTHVVDALNTRYLLEAVGDCELCNRTSTGVFSLICSAVPTLRESIGKLPARLSVHGNHARFISLRAQHPEAPKPSIPEHLPERLAKPYLEAEKAFNQGIWSLAAAGYRKAVDRAITPLVPEADKGRMLGPKIGSLEKTKVLPEAMLEWIRLVKDDGNFALHDDEHDFETREQVQPAREFAHMLLTYLYTFPAKVRIARGLPPIEQIDVVETQALLADQSEA